MNIKLSYSIEGNVDMAMKPRAMTKKTTKMARGGKATDKTKMARGGKVADKMKMARGGKATTTTKMMRGGMTKKNKK